MTSAIDSVGRIVALGVLLVVVAVGVALGEIVSCVLDVDKPFEAVSGTVKVAERVRLPLVLVEAVTEGVGFELDSVRLMVVAVLVREI